MRVAVDGHSADDFLASRQEEVADQFGLVEEAAGVEAQVEDKGAQGATALQFEEGGGQIPGGVGVELIHPHIADAVAAPRPHGHHLHEVADHGDDDGLGHALAVEGQRDGGALGALDALDGLMQGQAGGPFSIDGENDIAVLDAGPFGR